MGTVRLSSLALEGFKSFATRAAFSFPGAITAVVGPNGAGKSNIADAIAWVLGEQSARLLRSQTMADVVFAGAPSRPPLGAAEVHLTLSGDDSRWSHAGWLSIGVDPPERSISTSTTRMFRRANWAIAREMVPRKMPSAVAKKR